MTWPVPLPKQWMLTVKFYYDRTKAVRLLKLQDFCVFSTSFIEENQCRIIVRGSWKNFSSRYILKLVHVTFSQVQYSNSHYGWFVHKMLRFLPEFEARFSSIILRDFNSFICFPGNLFQIADKVYFLTAPLIFQSFRLARVFFVEFCIGFQPAGLFEL